MRLFFFLFPFLLFCKPIDIDLLFVLQDAGETNAILPVVDELEKEGVDFVILAGGVAENICLAQGRKTISYSQLGFSREVDTSWGRGDLLTQGELEMIEREIHPKVVCTGVAFEFQGQILKRFREKKIETIAYWDNFNPDGSDAYFQTARHVHQFAKRLFVPSSTFSSALNRDCVVVGQPSLEVWRRELLKCEQRSIQNRLGISPKKKTFVFIGGYGREYEEGFSLFVDLINELDPEQYQVLVQPHPKTDGFFEKEFTRTSSLVRVLAKEITTIEAIAISDTVFCHQSSVGFQALSAGKKVLYIVPSGQNYSNPAIDSQLARRVGSFQEFEGETELLDFFEVFQTPRDPIHRMTSQLLESIERFLLLHKACPKQNENEEHMSCFWKWDSQGPVPDFGQRLPHSSLS